MNQVQNHSEFRKLPAVDALLRDPAIGQMAAEFGQAQVIETVRDLLAKVRQQIAAGEPAPAADDWTEMIAEALAHQFAPSLRVVINATGVIIHTNLGRAPLSAEACRAVVEVASTYSNLEYGLEAGSRGSRHDHPRRLLAQLTGAEDALVVNNNASAVFLALAALCQGREVLVSRGQLVEIGGGFRIPDVLRQSGARLVEVGTTNRTHGRDYSAALSPNTAAIMRIHSSNFKQIGFVSQPELAEMAQIAHSYISDGARPVLLIDDLGSGSLLDTAAYGLAREPMVQESLAAGADLVTFSGDKLLGGPQAGIIVGRKTYIDVLRRHPLARALRVDKMTLAALDATLRSYQRGRATSEIPVWQMISASVESIEARARAWAQHLQAAGVAQDVAVWPGESAIGGGSLPGETLPTFLLAVAVAEPDSVAARLRAYAVPVVCRIYRDRLVFDPRTVLPGQEDGLLAAIVACIKG